MKKRLILILVSLLLIGSFAACDMEFGGLVGELFSEGVGDYIPSDDFVPETAVEETWIEETWIETDVLVEEHPAVDLPENVFPGETITILGSSHRDIGLLDVSTSFVHELSYARNQAVEEAFNIRINTEYVSPTEIANMTKTAVQAGVPDYDIVMAEIANSGAELAQNGYLVDLGTLAYVDLTGSAWDASVNEGLAIGNYVPMATGALLPSSDLHTAMIAFHSQMADEMGVDLYDYVICGGWTLAKMHTFVNMSYTDLNGNGMKDSDDRFGLALEGDRTYAFACGADVMLVGKDAQNLPVVNDTALDRMMMAYDEFYTMVLDRGCTYLPTYSFTDAIEQEPQVLFESGRALLYGTDVNYTLERYGSGMSYGILPYPKLDEEQENYQALVSTAAPAVMVPKSARNYDLAGYALEALAQISDGLYRDRISAKVCHFVQDSEMLMLIWESKTLDFGSNYLIGELGSKVQYFGTLLDQQSGTVATWLTQQQKAFQKSLDKLIAAYEKMN